MALTCAYQPIVTLETGEIFGYEGLARDDTGKFPADVFETARLNGTLGVLDWECRARVVQGALDAGLRPPLALFINNEPSVLNTPVPEHLMPVLMTGVGALRIYSEITERAISERPAELIEAIQEARMLGLSIAIDDVGADPRSLAMLPVIKPDLIKLDLSLVQAKLDFASAAVMTAVRAYAQATGATILAEGIENHQHLRNALTLGATLGQGWLFGHPGALPQSRPIELMGTTIRTDELPRPPSPEIPTDIVNRTVPMTMGNKEFLIAVSKHLEEQAMVWGEEGVVVTCFQQERFFDDGARARYARLAEKIGVVVALGEGMPDEPAPGVQGGALDPADGLVDEWTIAVMGPHYCAALVARDLGDGGPDGARRFDFAMTFAPADVVDIVIALLSRVRVGQPVSLPLAV